MKVNQDLKAEIASKHSEIKALRMSKASATTEIENKKSEIKSLNHYIKAFKHQNTELLKSTNNHLLTKSNDLEKVKQELQAERESKNSEIQALWNSWNDLSRHDIEKVKKELKAEIDSKDSEIKVLQEWLVNKK